MLRCTLIGAVLLAASASLAEDYSRVVIGGDILHSASALADSEGVARFLADQQAIGAVISECGFAHREIRVWNRSNSQDAARFRATATAGISWEDCESAKLAGSHPDLRNKLTNQVVERDQELYREYLVSKLVEKRQAVSNLYFFSLFGSGQPEHLKILEDRIERLERVRVTGRSARLRTIPAKRTMPEFCRIQYQQLMQEATVTSVKENSYGNLTNGKMAETLYSRAQKLLTACRSLDAW